MQRIEVDCSVFITGTDTGVGKTHVAVQLLRQLAREGRRVVGMKPVAAGAHQTVDGWRNEDALALLEASSVPCHYTEVNPVCLPRATAPHIAAAADGHRLDVSALTAAWQVLADKAEVVVVEGAGGWFVPLAEPAVRGERGPTLADLAVALRLPVMLVVGIRLGALNHALLTAAALQASGLPVAGWVANHCEPDFHDADDYVSDLQRRLPFPCVGRLDFQRAARAS
ncbi:MAG: dethiobiotin synthase [Pseudomonadota bacterium]